MPVLFWDGFDATGPGLCLSFFCLLFLPGGGSLGGRIGSGFGFGGDHFAVGIPLGMPQRAGDLIGQMVSML